MGDEKRGYTFTDKKGETGKDDTGSPNKPQGHCGRTEDVTAQGKDLKIDFPTLIMSFASAAMISIGEVPDPMTGQINQDLELARQNIDILSLLQAKTRGNLSPEEENLIEDILYDLRLGYAEAKRGGK